MQGRVKKEVEDSVRMFSDQQCSEVVELIVQSDHVHLICQMPPKISVSEFMGKLKGRSAIRILRRFPEIRQRRYWGNHFWAKGYCADTVGIDEAIIRKYVKYQEKQERKIEQQQLKF